VRPGCQDPGRYNNSLRALLKGTLHAVSLCLAFPAALTSGFGRFESSFHFWAQFLALLPGLPGEYLRAAYYRLTLTKFGPDSRISFGTFLAHPQASIGRQVYVGSYSIIGRTTIGDRTQIASGVQILSGRRQHGRGGDGRMMSSDHGAFETVAIGPDCWLGAGAIIAAGVGAGSTIGAGAIVVSPIPEGVVAVGNPARVIRSAVQAEG
jgi:virginiamycin A acetyltransferase